MGLYVKGRGRRGLVLVLILWVLVVLAVLAVLLVQDTKLDNAVRIAEGDRVTARWLARAGVYRAMSVLASDVSVTDSENDSWYDNSELFGEAMFEGGVFSVCSDRFYVENRSAYGLVDEASKLNVNTASREALLALPGMTEELASAILEWREGERPQVGEVLGTLNYHEQLADGSVGESKQYFHMAGGLGKLVGFSEAVLYGEDRNLNGVLENNENDGEELRPMDNGDGVLDRGLLAYMTVYSYELNRDGQERGRININTAGIGTLITELGIEAGEAKWIVANRGGGYGSIADILDESAVISGDLQGNTQVAAQGVKGAQAQKADVETSGVAGLEAYSKVKSVRPGGEVFRRIADRITVTSEEKILGRINVNTAGLVVLATLPGVDIVLAEAIVKRREALAEGFVSIAELMTVEGMTAKRFKVLAEYVTVRSYVFTVRSEGKAERTGLRHKVEAVVERTDTGVSVVSWREER